MKKKAIKDYTLDELLDCYETSTFMRNFFRRSKKFPYWEKRVEELRKELIERVSSL